MLKGKVLFQLSGSIACYKACHVLSRLVQAGYDVQVVATRGALEFVGAATLEGLSGKPVLSDVFTPGHQMDHIHLMKWADLVVLCPASANTINKLAAGVGDDLLTTLFLAHDFQKPYLVAPAMNTKMYDHPATRASLTKLSSWGVEILETASGTLACGDVGEGKLLDPEIILDNILARLPTHNASVKPLKVIVTSGGTREPIDGVRTIANTSTGKTGAAIADELFAHGHDVTFVHARESSLPEEKSGMHLVPFISFSDLDSALKSLLGEEQYDAVVHAAAVSDFSIDSVLVDGVRIDVANGKMDSSGQVSLALKNNPKILTKLKSYSRNPKIKVVGFKLTNQATTEERQEAVKKVSEVADLIVHNDLSEITSQKHAAVLFAGDEIVSRTETKKSLALEIEKFLSAGNSREASL
jgi:phosphopantothenoylcysteine decarboxylase / phosphopantothenate---cysteine ligase